MDIAAVSLKLIQLFLYYFSVLIKLHTIPTTKAGTNQGNPKFTNGKELYIFVNTSGIAIPVTEIPSYSPTSPDTRTTPLNTFAFFTRKKFNIIKAILIGYRNTKTGTDIITILFTPNIANTKPIIVVITTNF